MKRFLIFVMIICFFEMGLLGCPEGCVDKPDFVFLGNALLVSSLPYQ